MDDLGLDYIDLYLVHFPIALRYVDFNARYPAEWIFDPSAENPGMELDQVPLSETWGAMEQLVESGLVRQIGVCNYRVWRCLRICTDIVCMCVCMYIYIYMKLHIQAYMCIYIPMLESSVKCLEIILWGTLPPKLHNIHLGSTRKVGC